MTLSQNQIYKICNTLAEEPNLTRLMDKLGVEYVQHPNRLACACPVHGGDNENACTIFTDGDIIKGNWRCWTHQCESEWTNSLFGFVRGVLSYKQNKKISLDETEKFCTSIIGNDIDISQVSVNSFDPVDVFNKKTKQPEEKGPSREQIRSKLCIPAEYFIKRGWSAEILDHFDVGLSNEKGKQMSGRAVAPIYDQFFNYVGAAGRATNEEMKPKWLYSKGFKRSVFYGIHHAYNYIKETGVVILVEGQGDVWRLHEAGYPESVGIFGCSIGEDQLVILEEAGVMDVVVLTDTDDAGQKAYIQIVKKCGRRFNYHRPEISTKDIGDMSIEQVRSELGPQLDKIGLKGDIND
jgi:5S rRNA maturation endonuclease (ribonuclease M5)